MACIEDLPDELLILIWNKLKNVEVLYSFVGVNRRFDQLVRDISFTRSIEIVGKDSNDQYSSLDRLRFDIIPLIHEKIECLTVESLFLNKILSAGQYSHLHHLILLNFGHRSTREDYTDQSPFVNLFKRQITHLNVSIDDSKLKSLLVDENENLYAFLSSTFPNLIDFSFTCHGFWRRSAHLTIDSDTVFFPNLIHLRIHVDTLDDCLRLLDGRLIHLKQFFVNVYRIQSSTCEVDKKTLINLQCFSLTSPKSTTEYDHYIVPLLQQMISLQRLTLSLSIRQRSTYIDGLHFKNQIFVHLPELRTFDFEFKTSFQSIEQKNQISNEQLQKTFHDQRYDRVISYIDYHSQRDATSHIFSLPYTIDETLHLSSTFPGGLLSNVRSLLLVDTDRSFEHHFFLIINQSFPSLTYLAIFNQQSQQQSNEYHHPLSTIKFSRLHHLLLLCSHIDYSEQFLLETKTQLSHLTHLSIPYEHLDILTEHFTRHATRRNCAQLNSIQFHQTIVHSESFYRYFPSLK